MINLRLTKNDKDDEHIVRNKFYYTGKEGPLEAARTGARGEDKWIKVPKDLDGFIRKLRNAVDLAKDENRSYIFGKR